MNNKRRHATSWMQRTKPWYSRIILTNELYPQFFLELITTQLRFYMVSPQLFLLNINQRNLLWIRTQTLNILTVDICFTKRECKERNLVWLTRNPQFFSELITTQLIGFHMVSPCCLHFTYLPHHAKLQVLPNKKLGTPVGLPNEICFEIRTQNLKILSVQWRHQLLKREGGGQVWGA